MINLFALKDGDIYDSTIYGQSLVAGDVTTNTTGAWLSAVDSYGATFASDGAPISAIAVHLSAIAPNAQGSLILKLSSVNAGVVTESYPLSSFTQYDGSNNFVTSYSQNWQILKLQNPYIVTNAALLKTSFSSTVSGNIALMGNASTLSFDRYVIRSYKDGFEKFESTTIAPFTTAGGAGAEFYRSFGNGPFGEDTYRMYNSYMYVSGNAASFFQTPGGVGYIEFWMIGYDTTSVVFFDNGVRAVYQIGTIFAWDAGGVRCTSVNWGSDSSVRLYDSAAGTITNGNYGGGWQHFILARDGTTYHLYIDGIKYTGYRGAGTGGVDGFPNFVVGVGSGISMFSGLNGYVTGLRMVKGYCPFNNNVTSIPRRKSSSMIFYPWISGTPTGTTNLISPRNPDLLKSYGAGNNTDLIFCYNTTFNDSLTIHIGGAISASKTEKRLVTSKAGKADFNTSNLNIYNNGYLNFPSTESTTVNVWGANGIQIASDATMNIGTSSSYTPSNIEHKISLYNTQIDVQNGGNLNVYGAPKVISNYLNVDRPVGSISFDTKYPIDTWITNDSVYFSPSTAVKQGSDILPLTAYSSYNFVTNGSIANIHSSFDSIAYVPSLVNLSRNVKIQGYSGAQRGVIRSINSAKTSLNYAQLSNFGINATNKTGLLLGSNSLGSISLSGLSFIHDGSAGTSHLVLSSVGGVIQNTKISNNVFYKSTADGITLNAISSINLVFSNNLVLNSNGNGVTINTLSSSDFNTSSNIIIGAKNYNYYIQNASIPSFNVLSYNSGLQGIYVTGTNNNIPTIGGMSVYSTNEGFYINNGSASLLQNITATRNIGSGVYLNWISLPSLTSVVFQNIVSNYNTGNGVYINSVSGLNSAVFQNISSCNNLNSGLVINSISNVISANFQNIVANYNSLTGVYINKISNSNNVTFQNITANSNIIHGMYVNGLSTNYVEFSNIITHKNLSAGTFVTNVSSLNTLLFNNISSCGNNFNGFNVGGVNTGSSTYNNISSTNNNTYGVYVAGFNLGSSTFNNINASNNLSGGVFLNGAFNSVAFTNISCGNTKGYGFYLSGSNTGSSTFSSIQASNSLAGGVSLKGNLSSVSFDTVSSTNSNFYGFYLSGKTTGSSTFNNINASNNLSGGVFLNGAFNSIAFTNISSNNTNLIGFYLSGSNTGSSTFNNIQSNNNLSAGVSLNGSLSSVSFDTVSSTNNKTYGLYLSGNFSGASTFNNINASNNLSGGVFLNGVLSSTIFNNISCNNTNLYGFYIGTGTFLAGSPKFINIKTCKNLSGGFYLNLLNSNLNSLLIDGVSSTNNISHGFYLNAGSTTGSCIFNNITSTNNLSAGFYLDVTNGNLSSYSFSNLLFARNNSSGFKINAAYPVILNVNIINSSYNLDAGIEFYIATGNLSSITVNNNLSAGIRGSIGNGPTFFDGLTSYSTYPQTNILIISAFNYDRTNINSALLVSRDVNKVLSGTVLYIGVDKMEEFSLTNSLLSSSNPPLQLSSYRSKLEGSYMFHNCNSDVYKLSTIATTNYQTEILNETGISVMNENGLSSRHYKYMYSGKKSLDQSIAYLDNTISEKLEPYSNTVKLRSSSKFIPMDMGNFINVSVAIYKSVTPLYSGAAPRLMLKRNASLGYYDTVLNTSVGNAGAWEVLTGYIPSALNDGYAEVYIDCSGVLGSGTINIDSWNFN